MGHVMQETVVQDFRTPVLRTCRLTGHRFGISDAGLQSHVTGLKMSTSRLQKHT